LVDDSTTLPVRWQLEPMREDHLDAVVALEKQLFPEGPWSRAMFLRELRIPIARTFVVRDTRVGGGVVAYLCWRTLGPELEILNVAVATNSQRQGIGRLLVERVIGEARNSAAEAIHLEVRESNVAAIALYRRCGFSITGMRRHYYARDHHAVLMTWHP